MPPSNAGIDPRLLAAASSEAETVTVWMEFRDKGERDPADRADRLASAAEALSPRARARRVRAGVLPLVDERDLPVATAYLDALAARGLTPIAVSRWFNRAAVRMPGRWLVDAAALPFVRAIVPVERALRSTEAPLRPERASDRAIQGDRGVDARATPERTLASLPYGRTLDAVSQLNLASLHDCGYDGTGVLVCILDDGFGFHDVHEALRGQLIAPGRRRDFVDGDTTVTDGGTHGTSVMGCIAGNRPGAYLGTAFGAEFALARTERDLGEDPIEMLFWGLGAEWADSLGADILSSSLGYYVFDDPASSYTYADMDGHTTDVTRAAEIAASKGILVVNAVGNQGNTSWRHLIAPADVSGDSLIAVGAVNDFGDTARFSSAGPTADERIKPDLCALGVRAPVVAPGSDPGAYGTLDGTSLSTPFVAGVAACLMEAHPTWTPQNVIRALRSTASRADNPNFKIGYGIPDALAAHQWSPTTGAASTPPGYFELSLIGPNPLRVGADRAEFRFQLGREADGSAQARVRVMDLMGRSVRTVWTGTLCVGQSATATWDGRDDENRPLESGVYWITIEGDGRHRSLRLVTLN